MEATPDAGPPGVDPEAALDRLVEAGAVVEDDDGTLSTSTAFEDTRAVYHDSYVDVPETQFVSTIAHVFDLTEAEAAARIEENAVTRDELVAYLSLQSFLDDLPDRPTLAVMAGLVSEIGPGSPVPRELEELDDESYEAFLEAHPDAFLTVWKRHCDPCRALKEDLDDVLAALPDDVAVAGLDGEAVGAFRLEFAVDAAPATLCFRDGELVEKLEGRREVYQYEQLFADVYDADVDVAPDDDASDAEATPVPDEQVQQMTVEEFAEEVAGGRPDLSVEEFVEGMREELGEGVPDAEDLAAELGLEGVDAESTEADEGDAAEADEADEAETDDADAAEADETDET